MSFAQGLSVFFLRYFLLGAFLLISCATVHAQDASAAIEQSRLLGTITTGTDAGASEPAASTSTAATSSGDDSLGDQLILQTRERPQPFLVRADASVFYTDNAFLTPHDKVEDGFAVASAVLAWTPALTQNLEGQLIFRSAVLRYFDNSTLDFSSLGAGAGLAYKLDKIEGANLFARYDFTELLDNGGDELLSDHEWTVGGQKIFPLGQRHAIVTGLAASARISTPHSAQRDQISPFVAYQIQLSSALFTEISYRFGYFFYNSDGRVDRNHLVSWNVSYRLNNHFDLGLFASFAANRSNNSRFNYNVTTPGGGMGATVRF